MNDNNDIAAACCCCCFSSNDLRNEQLLHTMITVSSALESIVPPFERIINESQICEIEDEEISVTDRALVNNDMLLKALDEELVEIRKLSIQFASHVAKVEKIRILIKNNHQDY